MESLVDRLLAWFSLPEYGLSAIFAVSFVSATILPLGSEPAVFGFVKLNPAQFWSAVAVATAGNTLGGVLDYWMGLGAHAVMARGRHTRYLGWFRKLGPKTLFLSFLPVVGDPLCAVAGWLRLPFWHSVCWMALGKLARYLFVTSALLGVPDGWWRAISAPFG